MVRLLLRSGGLPPPTFCQFAWHTVIPVLLEIVDRRTRRADVRHRRDHDDILDETDLARMVVGNGKSYPGRVRGAFPERWSLEIRSAEQAVMSGGRIGYNPGAPGLELSSRRNRKIGDSRMIDEAALTKGQVRKLNALRKSLGHAIADEAFSKWLALAANDEPESDENARVIADALWGLVRDGKLMIRRGGYTVRRGRRRVIVEPAEA